MCQGRITCYPIEKEESDSGVILLELKTFLDRMPSIRVVFLALHSAYNEETRRSVNLIADLVPALSKDKSIRVYSHGKPYQCLLQGYREELALPAAPVDPIYGM